GWPRLLLCGLALGLALGSKFTAILLVPIAAILWVAARYWPADDADSRGGAPGLAASIGAFAVMCVTAFLVVEAVYLFPSDPSLYLAGFGRVNADPLAGQKAFLAGEFADRFYSYFVAAYFLKAPLAAVVLAGLGAVAVWRTRMPKLTRLFLF